MAAFQVKSFLSISASMINRMRASTSRVNDYNVGSVVRTMLEAVAQEIDQFYQQMVNALLLAIQTATYLTFNFTALPEVNASGEVVVTITPQPVAIAIPAGSVFTLNGTTTAYTVQADASIGIGATQTTVQLVASTGGTVGNVPAGASFVPSVIPAGFVGATNPAAFANGAPAESSSARKIRFQAYIVNLARSPSAGVEYGAKTTALLDSNGNVTEQVVLAAVVEPYETDNTQPVGLFFCYVHNGVGGTSNALVSQAQQVINGYVGAGGEKVVGYKAAGTQCTLVAATEQTLAISGTLTVVAGYSHATVASAMSAAHSSYILALGIGAPCLRAELDALAMDTPGVANFVLSSPTGDTAPPANGKLMPGVPTIS